MAENLRNIANLETLSTVPEGTNCIVEVDGVAKRAPYGGGGSALFIEIDVNNGTCSKTYEEVYEAFATKGGMVLANVAIENVELVCAATAALPAGVFGDVSSIVFFAAMTGVVLNEDNTVGMIGG